MSVKVVTSGLSMTISSDCCAEWMIMSKGDHIAILDHNGDMFENDYNGDTLDLRIDQQDIATVGQALLDYAASLKPATKPKAAVAKARTTTRKR